ncbi:DUF2075 domain-containing protein [Psychrobacter sanguinis]|uniref:DUF2075 domain-containing protein n=1 Tax=Psychrobacter sanguinis TaxID=861445 RepID=UPI0019195669|nr:DUF2075 domain-containing protein [Psychrobacter sanguinis]MCC3344406.1 DUF2075 domain-containing protein [Psychrobacter sanguinis]
MFEYAIREFPFDEKFVSAIKKEVVIDDNYTLFEEEQIPYTDHPVVYIIYCNKKKLAYIGETTNISSRVSQHLSNTEKRQLKDIRVIFSAYFNKSAALDIESSLIKFMQADSQYQLLNANAGMSDHIYYQKDEYQSTFKRIWQDLKAGNIVKHDLLDIENSDLFKFSPYKSLSTDQMNAIVQYLRVLQNSKSDKSTVFIQGSAGTGKTILAVYLIKLLMSSIYIDDLPEYTENSLLIDLVKRVRKKLGNGNAREANLNIALVVPMTSLRKTLKRVFDSVHGLSSKMVIGPSEVAKSHYDLLVIDEAHRLRRRKNITNYKSFDDTCKYFGIDENAYDSDELEWILRSSKNQLFFYDENQSIRPSDVEARRFQTIKEGSEVIKLRSQLRVKGGKDYIDFVDKLLKVDVKGLKYWYSSEYDLKLFSSFSSLLEELQRKEDKMGLCRLVSGYSWKWISKNEAKPDVVIEGIELFWNRTSEDWVHSTKDLKEMGCIHTTQGYDLNYTGIIFGSDITFNSEKGEIEVVKSNYFDRNGKVGIDDSQLHDYIINIYKTIMYRGIKGTYVYCCDKELEKYFRRYMAYE